uniref:Uncharacterized protein n=1 Tax=Siphoviridae sp. ctxvK3 TaxID=2827975 RepID=A0A8S5SGJ4_9CAUD|nr:MAG TPA: hypothetical protein [Siphoviridae sp. ctxvK3]
MQFPLRLSFSFLVLRLVLICTLRVHYSTFE